MKKFPPLVLLIFVLFFSCNNEDDNLSKYLIEGKKLFIEERFKESFSELHKAMSLSKGTFSDKRNIDIINAFIAASIKVDSFSIANGYLNQLDKAYKKGINYPEEEAFTLYLKSKLKLLTGEYSEALSFGEKALELKETTTTSEKIDNVKYYLLLSDINFYLDKVGAKLNSDKAMKIVQSLPPSIKQKELYISSLVNNARDSLWVAKDAKELEKAFDDAEKMLKIAEKTLINNGLEKKIIASDLYNLLGLNFHYKYKYYTPYLDVKKHEVECQEKSRFFFNKSLEIRRQIFGNNNIRVAESLNNLATESPSIEAYKLLEEATNIYKKSIGDKNDQVALFYNNIARTYNKENNFFKALDFFQKSLVALNLDFDKMDILSNPSTNYAINDIYQLEILEQKALTLKEIYNQTNDTKYLINSLDTWKLTNSVLSRIRNNVLFDNSKAFVQKGYYRVFDNSVSTAIELFHIQNDSSFIFEAYDIARKAKACILRENLVQSSIQEYSKIPFSSLEEESTLNKKVNEIKLKIRKKENLNEIYDNTNEAFKNLKDTLLIVESQLSDYRLRMRKTYPEHFKAIDNDELTISQIQNSLGSNDVIIEYFYTPKKGVFSFHLTKNNLSHFHIPNEVLGDTITKFRQLLVNKSSSKKEFVSLSRYLYKKLLFPFEKRIKGKNLIIVPDRELCTLPFDILLTKDTPINDWSDLPYLLKTNSILYAYSTDLLKWYPEVSSKENNILAFAPFADISSRVAMRGEKDTITISLSKLPFSADEIESIERFFNVQAFVKEEATKKSFIKEVPNYDIIHLPTHGYINDEYPNSSSLVFFPEDEADQENYLLSVNDIYNLNINAKLVVLSACSSGYGKILEGEGMISLARAFTYAGCPNTLLTLWDINDFTTAKIIKNIYKELSEGKRKDIALQQAKIAYLQKNKKGLHPYYWSAFSFWGNPTPL